MGAPEKAFWQASGHGFNATLFPSCFRHIGLGPSVGWQNRVVAHWPPTRQSAISLGYHPFNVRGSRDRRLLCGRSVELAAEAGYNITFTTTNQTRFDAWQSPSQFQTRCLRS